LKGELYRGKNTTPRSRLIINTLYHMNNLKILIVEDQVFTAENIREILEDAGFSQIRIARTYEEALITVVRFRPDLIIMDIELGSTSGDGIRVIQEVQDISKAPVLYLTGKDDNETFARAHTTRPAAYLLKPFNPKELVYQVQVAAARIIAPEDLDSFFVYSNSSHIRVKKEEIVYLLAERAFTHIYRLYEPQPLLVTMNIGHLGKHLRDPRFYKLSQSIYINLHHLQKIRENELYFEGMTQPLIVSNAKKAELKKRLNIIHSPRGSSG